MTMRRVVGVVAGVAIVVVAGTVGFSVASDRGGPAPENANNPLKQVSCDRVEGEKVIVAHRDGVYRGGPDEPIAFDDALAEVTKRLFGEALPQDVALVRAEMGVRAASVAVEEAGFRRAVLRFEHHPEAGWWLTGWTSCPSWAQTHGLTG